MGDCSDELHRWDSTVDRGGRRGVALLGALFVAGERVEALVDLGGAVPLPLKGLSVYEFRVGHRGGVK